jgi:uncharacterized protein
MRIYIKDIRPEGVEVKDAISAKDLGLTELDGVQAKTPVEIKGFVQKKGDTVLLDLKIKGVFSFDCARCLEPIEKMFERDFSLDYSINRAILFLDVDDDFRQDVLLSYPDRILCKDSCEGLCADCGVNLNIEKCKCGKK